MTTTPNTEQEQKEREAFRAWFETQKSDYTLYGPISFGFQAFAAGVAYEAARATPAQPDKAEVVEDWRPPCPEIEPIRKLAREVGYAVGEHGSKIRDYDLIAVPWAEDAVAYNVLVEHLCKGLNARLIGGIEGKPLGRRACCLQIKDRYLKHIDLSIAPRGSAALPPHRDDSIANIVDTND